MTRLLLALATTGVLLFGAQAVGAADRAEIPITIENHRFSHADSLIERILYLEGVPNVQRLGKVNVGQTVPEQLRLDLEVETAAVKTLNAAIELARGLGDNGTRELLERILHAEEEHANWLEAQLSLIAQAGEGYYLAQQIRGE
jgi:bacterioferritin